MGIVDISNISDLTMASGTTARHSQNLVKDGVTAVNTSNFSDCPSKSSNKPLDSIYFKKPAERCSMSTDDTTSDTQHLIKDKAIAGNGTNFIINNDSVSTSCIEFDVEKISARSSSLCRSNNPSGYSSSRLSEIFSKACKTNNYTGIETETHSSALNNSGFINENDNSRKVFIANPFSEKVSLSENNDFYEQFIAETDGLMLLDRDEEQFNNENALQIGEDASSENDPACRLTDCTDASSVTFSPSIMNNYSFYSDGKIPARISKEDLFMSKSEPMGNLFNQTTSNATRPSFGIMVDSPKYSNLDDSVFEEDCFKKTNTPLCVKIQSRTETGAKLKESNVSGNSNNHVSASNKLAQNRYLSTIAESELSSSSDQTLTVSCSSSSSRPYQNCSQNCSPLGKKSSSVSSLIDSLKNEQFKSLASTRSQSVNDEMIQGRLNRFEACYSNQPIINSASSCNSQEMCYTPARDCYIPQPSHPGVNTQTCHHLNSQQAPSNYICGHISAIPFPNYNCDQCMMGMQPNMQRNPYSNLDHRKFPQEPPTFLPLLGPTEVSGGYVCLGSSEEILLEIINPSNQPLTCIFKPAATYESKNQSALDDMRLCLPAIFQIEAKMSKNVTLTFIGKKAGKIEAWIEVFSRVPLVNSLVGSFLTRLSVTVEEPKVRVVAVKRSGSPCNNSIDFGMLRISRRITNESQFVCKIINEGNSAVPLIICINTESKGCHFKFIFPIQELKELNYKLCQDCKLLTTTIAICKLPGSFTYFLPVEVSPLEKSECNSDICKLNGEMVVGLKSEELRSEMGTINLKALIKHKTIGHQLQLPNEIENQTENVQEVEPEGEPAKASSSRGRGRPVSNKTKKLDVGLVQGLVEVEKRKNPTVSQEMWREIAKKSGLPYSSEARLATSVTYLSFRFGK